MDKPRIEAEVIRIFPEGFADIRLWWNGTFSECDLERRVPLSFIPESARAVGQKFELVPAGVP